MELDKIDKAILAVLQHEAKITNAALAQKVNLSAAATLERVKKLEHHAIITDYCAQIDPVKLGLRVEIMLGIRLQRVTAAYSKLFKAAIDKIHAVTTCYQTVGTYDFIAFVQTKDLCDFQTNVLEKLYVVDLVDKVEVIHLIQLIKRKPLVLE